MVSLRSTAKIFELLPFKNEKMSFEELAPKTFSRSSQFLTSSVVVLDRDGVIVVVVVLVVDVVLVDDIKKGLLDGPAVA